MTNSHPRMKRECKTIEAMIQIFCKNKHEIQEELCPACTELLEYAFKRLEACPFQENKTTCAKCPIHCYNPTMRAKIREIMRYAGPRMIFKHPVLAIQHLLDRRKTEAKKK